MIKFKSAIVLGLLVTGIAVTSLAEAGVNNVGPQGPIGKTGPAGPVGPRGANGPAGSRGATGQAGTQGLKGDTGPVGPQGIAGPAGPQGPKGDIGTPGKDGSAGSIPTYLTPIFVDANGIYIATLIGIFDQLNIPTLMGQINILISKNGYLFGLNDNGEFPPLQFDGYEDASCLGVPTLIRLGGAYGSTNRLDVFKNGRISSSFSGIVPMPTDIIIEPDLYYIPKQSAFYQQQVYVYTQLYDATSSTYSMNCVPLEEDPIKSLRGSNFYKPLLNDPAITGVDPIYINSLQKPFNISIDY
jgi:hypothetical protein